MVLPLLGLLALGALELGREPIENRRSAILGRNRQRAYARGTGQEGAPIGPLSGLLGGFGGGAAAPRGAGDPLRRGGRGDTKFNESGAIFYGGGDLSATNFLNARYQQDLQTQQEAAAKERTSISAGPGYLNAALNREKFELAKTEMEEQKARANLFFNTVVDTHATDLQQKDLQNYFMPSDLKAEIAQKIFTDQVFGTGPDIVSPVTQFDIDLRGDAWGTISDDAKREVLNLEAQSRIAARTIQFMTGSTALSRSLTPEKTSELMGTYAMNSLNYLRNKYEAGAMAKEDIILFTELAGDPNKWNQMTLKERGTVKSLLANIRVDLAIANRISGLRASGEGNIPPPEDPESGEELVPKPNLVTETIEEARQRALESTRAPAGVPLWKLGQGGFGGPTLSPGGT